MENSWTTLQTEYENTFRGFHPLNFFEMQKICKKIQNIGDILCLKIDRCTNMKLDSYTNSIPFPYSKDGSISLSNYTWHLWLSLLINYFKLYFLDVFYQPDIKTVPCTDMKLSHCMVLIWNNVEGTYIQKQRNQLQHCRLLANGNVTEPTNQVLQQRSGTELDLLLLPKGPLHLVFNVVQSPDTDFINLVSCEEKGR